MRWFIEISPLGASEGPKHKWCIEAAGWQPALKEARTIRGETGPLGGFSIELLDDGARAVDPVSRIRYVIRSAPADAPLTHVNGAPAAAEAPKAPEAAPAAAAASDDVDVDIPVDEADAPGDVGSGLPAYELLHTRQEEPSAQSPLTYREHVYAVAEGTGDAEIERLLRARFEAIKGGLAGAKPGLFVNLAIFDHAFTGRPTRKPRATLAWKDWRGAPDIRLSSHEGASPLSFAAPTSASAPIPRPSVPGAELTPSAPPPTAAPPTEVASTEPAPTLAPPTEIAQVAAAADEAAPAKAEPPAAAVAPPEPTAKAEPPAAAVAPPEPLAAKAAAPPAEPMRISTAPLNESSQRLSAPMSAIPKTMPAAAPARREPFIPPAKTAAEAGPRINGDDLIVELFEACGAISFLRDSLEGADFILGLALEKMPSEVGLVSLFDINRREFVVVRQAGGARSVVLSRLPERAALAQAAMRKGSAIVIASAENEPRAKDDRFRTLGVELRSLMVAPVEQSGRYLGLIELCNPVDGRPFTEGDGHALTYIGEQYAAFVAERGPLLDPDTVIDRHQKR